MKTLTKYTLLYITLALLIVIDFSIMFNEFITDTKRTAVVVALFIILVLLISLAYKVLRKIDKTVSNE